MREASIISPAPITAAMNCLRKKYVLGLDSSRALIIEAE